MSIIVTLLPPFFFIAVLAFTTPVLSSKIFSIDLIHRDSPHSPLYDHSLTDSQRLVHALRRSSQRIEHLHSLISQPTTSSSLTYLSGDFTTRISVGTPPQEIVASVDTASDLFWTTCAPARAPYNPNNSSTYEPISCDSSRCHSLADTSCQTTTNTCQHMSLYLHEPSIVLDLGTDIVTLGQISAPNAIFGCARDVNGVSRRDWSGIVGLGGGPLSLISQLSSSTGPKFSYCLSLDQSQKSKITFGVSGELSGSGVVATPLLQKSPDTLYYMSLLGISVSNKRLDGHGSAGAEFKPTYLMDGNMIIDSVSLTTTIPPNLYQWLDYTLRYEMNLEVVSDPTQHGNLCFGNQEAWSFPQLTLHLKNGDLVVNPSNYFVEYEHSVLCLAIRSSNSDVGVLGNLAQRNLVVGYDLESMTLSFKPSTNCSNI